VQHILIGNIDRQQRHVAQLLLQQLLQRSVHAGQQQNLLLLQRTLLHHPGTKQHGDQACLLGAELRAKVAAEMVQRALGGAHQSRIEPRHIQRNAVIYANREMAAVQRLRQVGIELYL